jgi:hypothetical protein
MNYKRTIRETGVKLRDKRNLGHIGHIGYIRDNMGYKRIQGYTKKGGLDKRCGYDLRERGFICFNK